LKNYKRMKLLVDRWIDLSIDRASCKIPSSGIRFGRGVDFSRFERQ